MLVTGLILMALNQKVLKKIDKIKLEPMKAIKTIGIGLLFIIIIPILSVFASMLLINLFIFSAVYFADLSLKISFVPSIIIRRSGL